MFDQSFGNLMSATGGDVISQDMMLNGADFSAQPHDTAISASFQQLMGSLPDQAAFQRIINAGQDVHNYIMNGSHQ